MRVSSSEESSGGEVLVYQGGDGEVRVEVRLERETVWLSLGQMVVLFGRDKSVISRHLRSVFSSGEVARESVVAKNATTATDGKTYLVEYFNLDAILSVGYRVNSKRGTQFRIWATRTLREHLLRGFSVNERRLRERGIGEMEQAVSLLARTLTNNELVSDEGRDVLGVVQHYSRAWRLLVEYDEERLAALPSRPVKPTAQLSLDEARYAAVSLRNDLALRGQAGSLFGQELGEGLARIVGALDQTFDGAPLYPNAQVRAAHLLYFVIKDHPFGDGNKRIGALLFLDYLRRSGLLLVASGAARLSDNAVVALALLVAESEPSQKELMIRLVLNLLGDETR
jgi:hypothetical protein